MYIGEPRDVRMLKPGETNDSRPVAAIEMPTAESARLLLSYGSLVVSWLAQEAPSY